MAPIDIVAIEHHARRLRAQEMQRVQGLVSKQMKLYGHLLAATVLTGLIALSDGLFRLFSWNPHPPHTWRHS
jgi:hypothetical protein